MGHKPYGGLDIYQRFEHLYEFINTHNSTLLRKWWHVIEDLRKEAEK